MYNVYIYVHFNHHIHITLKVIINSLVFHHSRVPLIRIMSSGINRTRRAIRAVRKTRMTRATRSTEAPEEIPLPPPLVTASTTGTIQVSKILSDTSTKNCQIVENTKTSLTSTFKEAPIHPFWHPSHFCKLLAWHPEMNLQESLILLLDRIIHHVGPMKSDKS